VCLLCITNLETTREKVKEESKGEGSKLRLVNFPAFKMDKTGLKNQTIICSLAKSKGFFLM